MNTPNTPVREKIHSQFPQLLHYDYGFLFFSFFLFSLIMYKYIKQNIYAVCL